MRSEGERPVRAWAAMSPSGDIFPHVVRATEESAISRLTDGFPQDWPRLQRDGWRVVRVSVVEGW